MTDPMRSMIASCVPERPTTDSDAPAPDSPLETIERALISAHDVTSEDAERATEWLAELMRRDWAVRVLDAFRAEGGYHSLEKIPSGARAGNQWDIEVHDQDGHFCGAHQHADIPTVRLAAAQAVYPELPDAVRAELGECP